MPGSVVRDALATDLLDGLTLDDETFVLEPGTAWEAGWCRHTQFVLAIATVTGSSPTLDIDIQGCETSDFSTDAVVTLATISAGDEADGTVLAVTADVNSKYVRAAVTITGTTVVYTATLTPVPAHDREVRGSHPTSKALA